MILVLLLYELFKYYINWIWSYVTLTKCDINEEEKIYVYMHTVMWLLKYNGGIVKYLNQNNKIYKPDARKWRNL